MATSKPDPQGNEGFVSSSKGITLSVISLGVWTLSLILFRMADAIVKGKIDYQNFCLFASFILSVASGIYISRLIYQRTDKWRTVAMVLNILLIYSSANGIQAGHAALAKAEAKKTDKNISQLALFGLLDARPWLRDAVSTEKIKTLSAENAGLVKQVSELKNRSFPENNDVVIKNLTESNRYLQNENENLRNQLGQIKERIDGFNSIRAQWLNKEKTDERFKVYVSKFRESLTQYLGSEYYNQLFYYNLKY